MTFVERLQDSYLTAGLIIASSNIMLYLRGKPVDLGVYSLLFTVVAVFVVFTIIYYFLDF